MPLVMEDIILRQKKGVYQILTPKFKTKLEYFLDAFEDYREEYIGRIDPSMFKELPYVDFDKDVWKLRQLDIELIKKIIPKSGKTLEIGAWNGWLSNRLVEMGCEVTALDFFTHHLDGLGAHKYYSNDWLTVQMNLDDLGNINGKYDLIVLNRCLPYFIDLNKTLSQLTFLLRPGGNTFDYWN